MGADVHAVSSRNDNDIADNRSSCGDIWHPVVVGDETMTDGGYKDCTICSGIQSDLRTVMGEMQDRKEHERWMTRGIITVLMVLVAGFGATLWTLNVNRPSLGYSRDASTIAAVDAKEPSTNGGFGRQMRGGF